MFSTLKRPASPVAIRATAREYLHYDTPTSFNPGKAGALIGTLNNLCGGDNNRRLVQGMLFGERIGQELSSRTFRPQHWTAITHWVDQRLDVDGNWLSHPEIETEISWILESIFAYTPAAIPVSQPERESEAEQESEVDDGFIKF